VTDNQGVLNAGLVTAISLATLFFFAGLWSPIIAIPIGIIFLIVAIGVYRRRRWSAYGGALLLVALAAVAAISLLRAAAPNAGRSIALVVGFFGISAVFLWREGRAMPPSGWPAPWITLAALVFMLPQIYRPFIMSGGSMENTVLIGDHILVRTFTGTPARGDLVQIRQPGAPKNILLKRVVAVGGDRVRIVQKALVINGLPITEPYAMFQSEYVYDFRDNFPSREPYVALPNPEWGEWLKRNIDGHEIVVPDEKFFVLGDNRDSSLDSRYFGFVDARDITGQPVLIYYSVGVPSHYGDDAVQDLATRPVLLTNPSWIRWNRIFQRL
jgi:signal peptidase I